HGSRESIDTKQCTEQLSDPQGSRLIQLYVQRAALPFSVRMSPRCGLPPDRETVRVVVTPLRRSTNESAGEHRCAHRRGRRGHREGGHRGQASRRDRGCAEVRHADGDRGRADGEGRRNSGGHRGHASRRDRGRADGRQADGDRRHAHSGRRRRADRERGLNRCGGCANRGRGEVNEDLGRRRCRRDGGRGYAHWQGWRRERRGGGRIDWRSGHSDGCGRCARRYRGHSDGCRRCAGRCRRSPRRGRVDGRHEGRADRGGKCANRRSGHIDRRRDCDRDGGEDLGYRRDRRTRRCDPNGGRRCVQAGRGHSGHADRSGGCVGLRRRRNADRRRRSIDWCLGRTDRLRVHGSGRDNS
ncbi:hypothetical protein C8T65DRAFT_304929, partial [Cerioporus squamosus]